RLGQKLLNCDGIVVSGILFLPNQPCLESSDGKLLCTGQVIDGFCDLSVVLDQYLFGGNAAQGGGNKVISKPQLNELSFCIYPFIRDSSRVCFYSVRAKRINQRIRCREISGAKLLPVSRFGGDPV